MFSYRQAMCDEFASASEFEYSYSSMIQGHHVYKDMHFYTSNWKGAAVSERK